MLGWSPRVSHAVLWRIVIIIRVFTLFSCDRAIHCPVNRRYDVFVFVLFFSAGWSKINKAWGLVATPSAIVARGTGSLLWKIVTCCSALISHSSRS